MTDAAREGLQAFTDKWRERWPEWAVVEVFLPAGQRQVAMAWFALLQEFTDAAWAGEDPTPGLAKLAWWQEELRGWAKGARRHPLGTVLSGQDVDWEAMAMSLPAFRERDAIRGDAGRLLQVLEPFALAAAHAEQALFGGPLAEADTISAGAASPWWMDAPSRARAMLRLCTVRGSRPRRLQAAIVSARLEQASLGQAGPASRWRTLWRGWRAARN